MKKISILFVLFCVNLYSMDEIAAQAGCIEAQRFLFLDQDSAKTQREYEDMLSRAHSTGLRDVFGQYSSIDAGSTKPAKPAKLAKSAFLCQECLSEFGSASTLGRHLNRKHARFDCSLCVKKFHKAIGFLRHNAFMHGKKLTIRDITKT